MGSGRHEQNKQCETRDVRGCTVGPGLLDPSCRTQVCRTQGGVEPRVYGTRELWVWSMYLVEILLTVIWGP